MMILEILSVKVGILLIRKELYGFIHMSCHHLQGLIQKVIILLLKTTQNVVAYFILNLIFRLVLHYTLISEYSIVVW